MVEISTCITYNPLQFFRREEDIASLKPVAIEEQDLIVSPDSIEPIVSEDKSEPPKK